MNVKYNYVSINLPEIVYLHICFQVPIPTKFRASQDGSQRDHCSPEKELYGSNHPTFTFTFDLYFKVNESVNYL
jgi:hypothetical protein